MFFFIISFFLFINKACSALPLLWRAFHFVKDLCSSVCWVGVARVWHWGSWKLLHVWQSQCQAAPGVCWCWPRLSPSVLGELLSSLRAQLGGAAGWSECSWSCRWRLLCCHCRKPCRCSSSTRPTSTPGTRTGRRRCTWRPPTRRWSALRSWSPCWAASTCQTAAGARRCTTPPSTATSRWALPASPALPCWAQLLSHLLLLACSGWLWTEPHVPDPAVTWLLPRLWDGFPACRNTAVAGRSLCRARVWVRCACTPGEVAVPLLPAAPGCPCFFGAGLPVKIRVAEWKGGFIPYWRNVQLCVLGLAPIKVRMTTA